ncbi:uncharacterized protein K444DRAFT_183935 [Hyaloscypha bicolor E]|uniref:NACHT domain-containing protein n=1 Tax=Hyaloscypha bicolor E TaxID=1095630 RepID=A0A2J6TRI3_9HELO|nr:uncharacterized protein K444DRAFT_183935 [Hyaloscypha bicolor E]PMD65633.1 hypothetical protein K444DRAFT_183935 [Hyaloscypha bicolor E]
MPATPMSRGDRLKWPLKKERTKELLLEIGRHKATMTLAMSARQWTALLHVLAGQDDIRGGMEGIRLSLEADRAERRKIVISVERRKMLDLLGRVDARKWQDSNIRLRQPGTGVWFTDGAEFKTWLSTNDSKLWINGIPGAGKTILISSIIQEIEKNIESSHGLAFFYCDYKDPETHSPATILGALARQLILQNERCFTQLTQFYQDHTTDSHTHRDPTPEELCELISTISMYFQTTMIVVDGLDEITNNRADVTRLLRSLNTQGGQVKTLFASRPEVDIGYELEYFNQVSIAAMSTDLRLYVASEIERRTREKKLRIRDPSLKDHIMTTLVNGADGMFRWVACQMDYLCECNNDRDRREALKKLPPDLPSSYERILERVNRSSRENQELVKKTLHWIVYAGGYFGTEKLIQALAVRDERHFDSNSMTTEEDILHWCSSLVRRGTITGKLELAHFTVKEFLEAINPAQRPLFQQYRLCDDHTVLAKACLNFILCQEFDGLPLPRNRNDFDQWIEESLELGNNYPFFDYACEYWSGHVHKSDWESIENNVMRLFDTKSAFEFWKLVWLQTQFWGKDNHPPVSKYFEKSSSPTALHWAAVFALDKLCAIFIERGLSVAQKSIIGTPLYCAPIHEDRLWMQPARQSVIRQLLDTGLDLDIGVDPEGQFKALTVALEDEEFAEDPFLVTMLLDSGARLSAEDFVVLEKAWQDSPFPGSPAEARDTTCCGVSIPRLIKTATGETLGLLPGAEFAFFSFMLQVVAEDWPLAYLQDFFEIRFSRVFPCCKGSDLDKIIRDESRDPQGRLVDVLSRAVRHSAPTIEEAISSLQSSVAGAVRVLSHSTVSFLLHFNDDLDASHRCSWVTGVDDSGETYLHYVSRQHFPEDESEEVIRVLLFHGASVVLPDKEGITPIELAARGFDPQTFQLFWDALVKTLAFETSPKLIERVICTAIRSNNEAVLRFLTEKLYKGKFLPENYLLEFAVSQESPKLLEFVLAEQRYEWDRGSTNGRVFEENTEEEGGDDDDGEFVTDSEDQLLTLSIGTKDDDCISRELQALYFAAKPEGLLSNFVYLIKRGMQVSYQYHNGNTILHILATNHDEDSLTKLNFLLKAGPKLDIHNDNQLTPLALTIRSRNIRGMEMLLDARADLNVLLADNQTILHMACYLGNKPAVEALLRCGCQASHRNNQGQTPKDAALACGYQDIAVAIQNTTDCQLSFRENHQGASSIEQLPRTALSNFAQTEEHGDLPLRVVSDADAINGSHDSTAMDIDTMAITSSPSTSSTEHITTNPTNMSETFTNNPLKRQNSSDEESRVQISTKRTRPR